MPNLGLSRPTVARPVPRYMLGAARAREQRQGPSWSSFLRVTGGTTVAIALVIGAVMGYRSDLLHVLHAQVVGAQVVDPNAAILAAKVTHVSLLRLNAGAAARRVDAVPGVMSARVLRDWPHGVVIDVTERQAWGYWEAMGVQSVIDAQGLVVEKARPPADGAPTVYETGASAPLVPGSTVDGDTVALVTRLQSDGTFQRLGLQPQRFEFDPSRGLVIQMAGGPAAVFGDSHDYEFKVAAWVAMQQRIEADHTQATEIDLRFGKELVVR